MQKWSDICRTSIFFFVSLPFAFADGTDDFISVNSAQCTSLGPYTSEALGRLRNVVSWLESLKSDCKGIDTLVSNVSLFAAQVSSQANEMERRRGSSADVTALRNRLNSLQRLASTISPEESEFARSVAANIAETRTQLALAMATNKTLRTTFYSDDIDRLFMADPMLTQIQKVLEQLPSLRSCQAKQRGRVAEVTTHLLPALLAFGNPIVGLASTAASRIISTLRDFLVHDRFEWAIEHGKTTKRRIALDCAMESLQTSICEALDDRKLLRWKKDQPVLTQDERDRASHSDKTINLVWQGYRVLTSDLPILTRWIRSMRIGLPTESKEEVQFKQDTRKLIDTFESIQDYLNWVISRAREEMLRPGASEYAIGMRLLESAYYKIIYSWSEISIVSNPYLSGFTEAELAFFLVSKTQAELRLEGNSSFLSGVELVKHPDNKDKLNSPGLIERIINQLEILERGNGTTIRGAEAGLNSILSERQSEDPSALLRSLTNNDQGQSGLASPIRILYKLRNWYKALNDDPKVLELIFKDEENPKAVLKLNLSLISDTVERLNRIIAYGESDKVPADLMSPLSEIDRIARIGAELNVRRSRDRFLVERTAGLVKLLLTSIPHSELGPSEIGEILLGSREDILTRLNYLNGSKDSKRADVEISLGVNLDNLKVLWGFFKSQFTKRIESMSKIGPQTFVDLTYVKAMTCARLTFIPDIASQKRILDYCKGTKLESENLRKGIPDPWKKKLIFDFDEVMSRENIEARTCAFRDWQRDSSTYELLYDDVRGRSSSQAILRSIGILK